MANTWSIERLSESALLVRFGNRIDARINGRVHAAAAALRSANLAAVSDIAPAYASLLLRFDPFAINDTDGCAALTNAVRACLDAATDSPLQHGPLTDAVPRSVEIPVCYGGDCGPDLAAVARHAGFDTAEVIARHTGAAYTVAMLGFAPGFAYLLGLDPALHVPRHATPRTRVPAGSVAIGGAQTGIYPSELPGGWNLIGRTPLALFDPARAAPALLKPGDHVRFRAIDAGEFTRLATRDR